jgi:putative hemolysin
LQDFIAKLCRPVILVEDRYFLIKFAESESEIKAAQNLRYRVFNLEQGHGKKSTNAAAIDNDQFDQFCLHLIVIEKSNNKIVGTYRIHPGTLAKANLGLYAATEYELTGIDNIIDDTVEVGRSCVCQEQRNGAVVALLWAGIAQIMLRGNFRYLLGCVSLTSTEPVVGWALYQYFCQHNKITKTVTAKPKPELTMQQVEQGAIDHLAATSLQRYIPPLFRGYLRLGAKICGKPVFDKAFGTIDFLTLLDLQLMPEKYFKHFKMR